MKASKPVIAWSHSRIDAYQNCPLRMYHTAIAKDVVEDFGPEADWGTKVHKAMERRLTVGAELPADMMHFETYALRVLEMARRLGGEIKCELQMAVDSALHPCDWFSKLAWSRCITDVLLVNEQAGDAIAIDWKTGKRKDNDMQLALQAAFIFRHYPSVRKVHSAFCWLKEGGAMNPLTFSSSGQALLWKQYLPVVRKLTDSALNGDWPARPSGLCQKYCPVTSCKHNGSYRK